jgi:hypothetical protein
MSWRVPINTDSETYHIEHIDSVSELRRVDI